MYGLPIALVAHSQHKSVVENALTAPLYSLYSPFQSKKKNRVPNNVLQGFRLYFPPTYKVSLPWRHVGNMPSSVPVLRHCLVAGPIK